jgi:isocitrate lyase
MLKVQRQEIRKGVVCKTSKNGRIKLGDDHKTFFAGDKALKADGAKNTSNQFESKKKQSKTRISIRK